MKRIHRSIVCLLLVLAMLAVPVTMPAGLSEYVPGTVTAQAARKTNKVVKKSKGYYSKDKVTGYWSNKKYKTNGLMRIYKFDKKHYMSKSKYNKMVKALKKESYKALRKAIGKGKLYNKTSSCNGGKNDYIYKYGNTYVFTTDDHIEDIR